MNNNYTKDPHYQTKRSKYDKSVQKFNTRYEENKAEAQNEWKQLWSEVKEQYHEMISYIKDTFDIGDEWFSHEMKALKEKAYQRTLEAKEELMD